MKISSKSLTALLKNSCPRISYQLLHVSKIYTGCANCFLALNGYLAMVCSQRMPISPTLKQIKNIEFQDGVWGDGEFTQNANPPSEMSVLGVNNQLCLCIKVSLCLAQHLVFKRGLFLWFLIKMRFICNEIIVYQWG